MKKRIYEKNDLRKVSFITDAFVTNCCFYYNKDYHRDDYLEHIKQLKNEFHKAGVDISTSDINTPSESEAILQYGTNVGVLENSEKKYYYLIALESPAIDSSSIETVQHHNFNKIFTYNDDLIDNEKYFKINDAHKFPSNIPKQFNNKRLCCMIAGNKSVKHPDELYTKRVEFIRWFEKHHPDEFDLYGTRWDERNFGKGFLGKILNMVKPLRKLCVSKFPSYKGKVEVKNEIMKNYKFSICYENIKDQNGYITEKIFDSFFAGCVPIYWGAKNITDHIPAECFIDKRDFSSLDEIYSYIKDIDEDKYMEYLNSIEKFLGSKQADPFRAEIFAETIVKEIMEDFNESA